MTQEDMAQEIIYPFGFDPSIARILGYVDAKIEECQKKEPGNMKIPFDIKFRPQIESGEYKVETRDGRPARIVCWDRIAGAEWQKKQMMKDAVEGRVFMSFAPGHDQMVMADVDLPTNTRVKVIIVKEDER